MHDNNQSRPASPGPRLSRSPSPGQRPREEVLYRSDLDDIMADMRNDMRRSIEESHDNLSNSLVQTVSNMVDRQNKVHQARFQGIEHRLNKLEAGDVVASASLAAMREQLAMASQESPPPVQDDSFDRAIDASVLKLRTANQVAEQAFTKAIRCLMGELSLSDADWTCKPRPFGNMATLRLKGTAGLAALRVRKLLGSMRDGDSWRDVTVDMADGSKTKLYIDHDKNGRQSKTELAIRKAKKILTEWYPNTTFFPNKKGGTVTHNWVPLARAVINAASPPTLQWNVSLAAELRVDTAAVDAEFCSQLAAVSRPDVQWG